jgi:type IX secretion system PorP/SprF family membrane protein
MKREFYFKEILLLVLFSTCLQNIHAQQDTQYTQYMYNPSIFNPGYAGTRDRVSFSTQYRAQWVGLEGAPRSFNVSANGPVNTTADLGIGIALMSDQIGPASDNTIAGDLAYRIRIDRYTYVSFGLKGGVNLLNIDYSKLTIFDTREEQFRVNIKNRLSPIVGAGAYVYNEVWYAGISVPYFLTTTHYEKSLSSVSNAKRRMTFYGIAGYVFYINDNLMFKPTILTKYTRGAPLIADVSANFLINEKLTLGTSYRFSDSFSALAGFQINSNFLIGYSYDYTSTDLGNYNTGSHEIFLRYEFDSRRNVRLLCPRFF